MKQENPYSYFDLGTRLVLAEEKPYNCYKAYTGTSLPLTRGKWSNTYAEWADCSASGRQSVFVVGLLSESGSKHLCVHCGIQRFGA